MNQNQNGSSGSTYEPEPQTLWLARRLNQHDEKRYPNNPCPRCNGSGWVINYTHEDPTGVKSGGQGEMAPCPVCYDRIHAAKNRLVSGLPEELKNLTLKSFECSEPWQRQALEVAVSFAKKPEGLLFLGGQSGCGKSHLAAGIIYRVSKSGSQPPLYYSWPDLLTAVRRTSRDWRSTDIRDTLKDCRMLVVLDDFLATPNGRPSSTALETAFEIISARTANKRPTVLASPYTAEKINALYSVLFKKIARAAGGRLISIDPDETKDYTAKRTSRL